MKAFIPYVNFSWGTVNRGGGDVYSLRLKVESTALMQKRLSDVGTEANLTGLCGTVVVAHPEQRQETLPSL